MLRFQPKWWSWLRYMKNVLGRIVLIDFEDKIISTMNLFSPNFFDI